MASNRISNNLVTASCAAVLAVYTAGYARTQSAANRIAAQVASRRSIYPPRPAASAPAPAQTAPSSNLATPSLPKPKTLEARVDLPKALPKPRLRSQHPTPLRPQQSRTRRASACSRARTHRRARTQMEGRHLRRLGLFASWQHRGLRRHREWSHRLRRHLSMPHPLVLFRHRRAPSASRPAPES